MTLRVIPRMDGKMARVVVVLSSRLTHGKLKRRCLWRDLSEATQVPLRSRERKPTWDPLRVQNTPQNCASRSGWGAGEKEAGTLMLRCWAWPGEGFTQTPKACLRPRHCLWLPGWAPGTGREHTGSVNKCPINTSQRGQDPSPCGPPGTLSCPAATSDERFQGSTS